MAEIFVNRNEAKEWFRDRTRQIPEHGVNVTVFHGTGGQGKSALMHELYRMARSKAYDSHNLVFRSSLIDFSDFGEETSPIVFLLKVRNGFAQQGLSLPGFDLALAFVWEEIRPQTQPPVLVNAWLSQTPEFIAEGSCDTIEIARSILGEEIQKIPFMGAVLTRVSQWVVDKSKHAWLLNGRDYIADFFKHGEVRNNAELVEALTVVLAKDLERAIADDDRQRLVLFLDEYENLFRGTAFVRDQPIDRIFRFFLEHATRLMAVVALRPKLQWAESPFWSLTDDDHYEVLGLDHDFSEQWLVKAGIDDTAMRAAILTSSRTEEHSQARHYPLLLNLLVKRLEQLPRLLRRQPQAEDVTLESGNLNDRLAEIVRIIIRDFPDHDGLRDMVDYIAIAGSFDQQMVEFFNDEFKTYLSGGGFEQVRLLTFVEQGEDGFYSLHKKIAEALRILMAKNRQERLTSCEDAIIDHLLGRALVDMPDQVKDIHLKLFAIAADIKLRQGPDGYVTWLSANSRIFQVAAKSSFLEELWRQAITACLEHYGEDHPDIGLAYSNIALSLDAQGRHGAAEPIYNKALDICRHALGEDHQNTTACLNNIACNLDSQGRPADAETVYRQALETRQRTLGEDHPETALSFDNLAFNLGVQGRHQDAEPLCCKALEIRRHTLGEEHPDTATSYNNVAFNMNAQGRYGEAGPLYEKALKIRQQTFGDEHPDTALSYNNVAFNLDAQGRYPEAARLYLKALQIRERILNEDHPDIAASLNNVAFNFDLQGRYSEAAPIFHKALEMRRRVLGETHPDTALAYNNIGYNLDAQGRFNEAEPYYARALEIRLRALGEEHPDTAASYSNVAYNLDEQGRHEEAEPVCRKALEIRQRVLGENHPDTAIGYNNLASNLDNQGRHKDAEPLYRKALDIRISLLGEDHPDTALSYNNFGFNLDMQGRYADADTNYRKALEIRLRVLGENHPDTATSYNNVAVVRHNLGDIRDAEELSRKALAIRQRVFGDEHPDTASGYHSVAVTLHVQGRHDEAEPLYRKALEISTRLLGDEHPTTRKLEGELEKFLKSKD